jgi:hypothetical protein
MERGRETRRGTHEADRNKNKEKTHNPDAESAEKEKR